MSNPQYIDRKVSIKRQRAVCPACGGVMAVDASRCPSCRFTGQHTLEWFPWEPPAMTDVMDTAGFWNVKDLKAISRARRKIERKFPQIRWALCAAEISSDVSLPVFGFWMMNACPPRDGDGERTRHWTVLLVLDTLNLRASLTPGYAVENWLRDDEWRALLDTCVEAWRRQGRCDAVTELWAKATQLLEDAWRRRHNTER